MIYIDMATRGRMECGPGVRIITAVASTAEMYGSIIKCNMWHLLQVQSRKHPRVL